MVSAAPTLDAVTDRLAAAGCVAPREEASELVAAAPSPDVLSAWVERRADGEPLAWITGQVDFLGRSVSVSPGVYVPRPQTEDLARRGAVELSSVPGVPRAADLCAGSGAVAAHLRAEVPGAVVVAVDIDPAAAACALRNGVPAVAGDVDAPLRLGAFDLVTAVAPYVPTPQVPYLPSDVVRYEPLAALDGGPDGLAVVRRVVHTAARLLRPGGRLLLEVGGDQDVLLAPALAAAGFDPVSSWADEDGDLRGVTARRDRGASSP